MENLVLVSVKCVTQAHGSQRGRDVFRFTWLFIPLAAAQTTETFNIGLVTTFVRSANAWLYCVIENVVSAVLYAWLWFIACTLKSIFTFILAILLYNVRFWIKGKVNLTVGFYLPCICRAPTLKTIASRTPEMGKGFMFNNRVRWLTPRPFWGYFYPLTGACHIF